MNLDFLQYVVPVIIIVGWAIAIIQANKVDGKMPQNINTVVMSIFTGGFLLFVVGIFNANANWITTLAYFLLTTTSISMATYYTNKKNWFEAIYFAVYGAWCLIKLLQDL